MFRDNLGDINHKLESEEITLSVSGQEKGDIFGYLDTAYSIFREKGSGM